MSEKADRHHLYVIGTIGDDGLIGAPCKVGITGNWRSRLRAVQTGSSRKVDYAFIFNLPNKQMARAHEKCFHDCLREKAMSGEWFDMHPHEAVHLICIAIQAVLTPYLTQFSEEQRQFLYDKTRASEAMALLKLPTEYNRYHWDA